MLKKLQSKPEQKSELWPQIRKDLLSHERGELKAVYPVLRAHAATRELADQHDREASEMENLIGKIDNAFGDTWKTLFDQLTEAVLAHAEEEEQQIFPQAQEAIGKKTAEELLPKFEAAKKQAEQVA
jgi:hemerythrin superfamily protein